MLVKVELSDPIARCLHLDGPQSDRRALEMLALAGFTSGRLSRGQVSEMLLLEFDETESFLHAHGAHQDPSATDYQRSSAALQSLLPQ